MAKSIRSKRMRKLRAFKRIRYGEKELDRLKKVLAKAEEDGKIDAAREAEAKMQQMDVDFIGIPAASDISEPAATKSKYPRWLSSYKIKRLAKQARRTKRKEMKRLKKEQKSTNKNRKSKPKNRS